MLQECLLRGFYESLLRKNLIGGSLLRAFYECLIGGCIIGGSLIGEYLLMGNLLMGDLIGTLSFMGIPDLGHLRFSNHLKRILIVCNQHGIAVLPPILDSRLIREGKG